MQTTQIELIIRACIRSIRLELRKLSASSGGHSVTLIASPCFSLLLLFFRGTTA